MKVLFDTHAFLWWADEPDRLSTKALEILQDKRNGLILSLASVWELQIKVQLGKLELKMPLADLIVSQQQKNRVRLLPVKLPHIVALATLPSYHRDPFDRILIAQARTESITLISHDAEIAQYPVQVIW
jgi:PIN domain nuclease of toxin-antitoxin system